MKTTTPILAFYRGEQPDAEGRKIDEIWGFDHAQLEGMHNFIQWLFPSQEPSQYNPNAPILDSDTIAAFRNDAELQDRMLRSLDVMLAFLELKVSGDQIVRTGDDLHWMTWKNHNFKRLTRILRCLMLCGLKPFAEALYRCLAGLYVDHHQIIDENTLKFWKEAIQESQP